MKVPPLDLVRQYETLKEEIDSAVAKVLRSGHFILGEEVEKLEEEIARFVGVRFAVACASGSDALLLPLMALGVGPQDEVITTPFTFVATATAIARLGARPVFADIDPRTFNIRPDCVEAAITPKTRAIILVDLFGQCAPLRTVQEIAAPRRIAVIEDACQSIGATHHGRPAGSFGTAAAFSFYPTKNLSAAGDSGMVVTDDEALARRLRLLRVHGSARRYHHDVIGVNSRMDAIQAAILRVKLPRLPEWSGRRRDVARRYDGAFAHLPLETPFVLPENSHVFHQYVLRVPGRDALFRRLAADGVSVETYYPLPLHLQPCFGYLGYRRGSFPCAEEAAERVLALPIFPEMTDGEVRAVVRSVERNVDVSP
ncbi:MAG: DegT/DnrJ/EryC1/StrS family aminotransferase [Planctomycetota bacterium]